MKTKQIYSWDNVPVIVGTEMTALILGISVAGVKKQAKEGKIPAFKIGKLWKFQRDDLRDFIERTKNT